MADWRRGGYAALGVLAVAGTGWFALHRAAPRVPASGLSATGLATVVRTDVTVRDLVGGTLGYSDQGVVVAATSGTLTWIPAVGTMVAADQRLYEVDGRPVRLWTGARPAWRDFAPGMADGPDVRQLERCLAALGYGAGLTVDDHFSAATGTAIRRWQHAHGLPRTGVIRLGEVVFRPAPVRVGTVPAALGAPVSPGTPILTVTATTTAVTVDLDPDKQGAVHPGDRVSVSLPGTAGTAGGRVATVGAAVPSGTDAAGGSAPVGTTVVIPVVIRLDSPAGAGIGPVQVAITTAQDRGVLAIPIDALLGAPGGGFEVAVHDRCRRRLVGVRTELFDESDGLVEIEGLPEGTPVEVPAS
ncbi:peptidoglycan-binding protein [Rugosimonospora africana]|uniref:Peptidoglycan-binding protein n=1 Tax=Rugosimonospora africana TaxID=556532 RepID=A0A8J3VUS8_9ACTN|nr:peptidoglycan-binding domain-containing protein [Rugosimonospora africana]GIH19179.1 peptidoglycan-binding protein [Rugosimonospora africana]